MAMSPQPKGNVPVLHEQRILKALEQRAKGKAALEVAVADALEAGASIREVAALSGLSTTTIQKYKRTQGVTDG